MAALEASELRQRTTTALLVERARREPGAVAFRAKRLGLYAERSWADYAARVAALAAGLERLGLARGERVAIMGDPCEAWLLLDQAAQALGAIVYGVYPTASGAELEHQLLDGGASVLVAEDQEHLDKALPLLERCPRLRHVVIVDRSALLGFAHPKLVDYDALAATRLGDPLGWLEAAAARQSPDDPAFIVYTSGTTGAPKGALVTHGRHLAGAANLVTHYPELAVPQRTVVYLPPCHVLGRDVAVTLPLIGGLVPHFGEDPEDLATTLFEVAPTVLVTVPRYLQKFAAGMLVGVRNTSRVKAAAYEAAMRVARRAARARWGDEPWPPSPLAGALARAAVLRPMLGKLGLDRLRLVLCGGAPLPAETAALWQAWGVDVREIYGQTEEAGAIVAGQRGPFPRPGDVGTLAAGWEMRLVPVGDDGTAIAPPGPGAPAGGDATRGEIWLRGDTRFEGYWGDPQATAAAFADGGWLRTGDVGELVDGRLRLVDRARDFIVTAGGKTLSPAWIENRLRASPYVGEAIVIGHARKHLAALIEIDFDTVSDWARARGVSYTGFSSLVAHPAVVGLIESEVARANEALSRVESIKAFRILPRLLDPEAEDEPVTATRKVKRRQLEERFRDLVESMYGDGEARLLAAGAGDVLIREPVP